jgi:putative ABC transport system permease protein
MTAALNVLLLGLGLASITFLTLVGDQLARAFDRDLAGIDVVVGAKGSPMQLILSGVLHLDVPPGNVPLAQVEALRQNPMIARVIPISLGDNVAGYRIVGTSPDYLLHYKAQLVQGRMWDRPMQVVLGATVAHQLKLQPGQTFTGAHGLGAGGHSHGDMTYSVVGVLAAQGGVLDQLILTDTASVWQVHEDHAVVAGAHPAEEDDPAGEHGHHDATEAIVTSQTGREITMALMTYKTPMAALSFPRYVNTQTGMQAAAPALEIARLLKMLGIGTDVLRAFAAILLLTAGLSVFIALWSAVRERRADLALLRMLGAPAIKVGTLLLLEALWLGVLATLLGLLLGQAFAAGLAWALALDNSLLVGGMQWPFSLWLVPCLSLGVAAISALLPMLEAYRVSVLELLQQP